MHDNPDLENHSPFLEKGQFGFEINDLTYSPLRY